MDEHTNDYTPDHGLETVPYIEPDQQRIYEMLEYYEDLGDQETANFLKRQLHDLLPPEELL